MTTKSPFFVKQHFLSPLFCEELVDDLNFTYPDRDQDDIPTKTSKGHEASELKVYERLELIMPSIEKYYNFQVRGTEPMMFEWYPDLSTGEKPHCENSNYVNKKWVRVRDRDFTGIVFMTDYQEKTPFDSDFEVFGGKTEFPQHQFGFQPERGTLILFPSGPHFLNLVTPIELGELFQVRFHIAASKPYHYNPTLFPGDYSVWFNNLA